MTPPRDLSAEQTQSIEQIAAALEEFLAEHPKAIVVEEGKVLFDMRAAKYSLATEHGRCTLQLWSEERNIVRRVSAAIERGALRDRMLRLTTQRFGQTRPGSLEILADRDRRTPSTREATRVRYLRALERVMLRGSGETWGEWKADGFRTAMDLEKSFGPAYARGSLVHGNEAWAVIAVNAEETQATVDGILTLGVLWLAHCRENAGGRRLYRGLRLIVPRGMATLTASRLAWMNADAAQWELWEFDEKTEEMEQRDAADHGNLSTRLVHAPNEAAARERFAEAAARVMALVPEAMRAEVEQRIQSGAEMAFRLHGLEFARVRMGYAGQSFNRVQEITFGAGANETPLTEENANDLRELVERLFERREAGGDKRDALYRMQPERWLESELRRDVSLIDARLDAAHVYTQVPAFAAVGPRNAGPAVGGQGRAAGGDRAEGRRGPASGAAGAGLLGASALAPAAESRCGERAGGVSDAWVLRRGEAGGGRSAAVPGGPGAARASGDRRGAAVSFAEGGVGAGGAGRAVEAAGEGGLAEAERGRDEVLTGAYGLRGFV